jgi:hypothetical protein
LGSDDRHHEEVNVSAWVSATYACEACGNRYTTSVYGQPSRVLGEGMRAEGEPPRFATVTRCIDGGRFLLVEEPDEVEP